MENNNIDSLMLLNGYQTKVCDLFKEWEFVKDEMLLPDRKNGSGNGTVHVYLQQNNLDIFKNCFEDYLRNRQRGQNISDVDCPTVEHFCLVSNLIGAACLTYHNLGCDDTKFNFISYVKDVLVLEENNMVKFSSIFKLSTENRPYFKQFTKSIFTKIIRSLFVGNKSAYKISLYYNPINKKVATFWQIGQALSVDFIIPYQPTLPIEKEASIINKKTRKKSRKALAVPPLEGFIAYLDRMGRSNSTKNNYITALNVTLPRYIREELKEECTSIFNITDYAELLRLDNILWKNDVIALNNRESHQQLSAGFHRYKDFIESTLTDEELAKILFGK